jgi:hypothetical protein
MNFDIFSKDLLAVEECGKIKVLKQVPVIENKSLMQNCYM